MAGFTSPSLGLGGRHCLVELQSWQSNDLPPPQRGLWTAAGRGLGHACHDRPQPLVHMPPALFRHTLGRGQHVAMSKQSGWPELSQSSAREAQVGFTPLTPACSVNVAIQACHPPSRFGGTATSVGGSYGPGRIACQRCHFLSGGHKVSLGSLAQSSPLKKHVFGQGSPTL